MIYSRFDSALSVRVYAGEPLTLELQLTDESGSVERTDGRVFDLVLVDVNGEAVTGASAPGAAAEDESGAYVTATLSGDQTALLAGVIEPGYFFREILANGVDPIVRGKIELYPAPIAGDPVAPAPPALGTAGRFLASVHRRATRIVVVQRGARGFTPEERLAFTRNPATGQPWIEAPTVEALAAWLSSMAGGGGFDPAELEELRDQVQAASNAATGAAANAGTKAAAADAAAGRADASALVTQQQGDAAEVQGDYAREQGDYAKAKGDAAAAAFVYDILPSPTGADQTAQLKALIEAGQFNPAKGTYYVTRPSGGTWGIIANGLTDVDIDWKGSRLVYRTNTPNDVADWLLFVNNTRYKWRNLTFDCEPRAASEMTITKIDDQSTFVAVTGTVAPDLRVDWATMDTYGVLDPLQGNTVAGWQYAVDDAHRPVPYPITHDPVAGTSTVTIPKVVANILSVSSMNPLTIVVDKAGVPDGALVLFDTTTVGLVQNGASLLNGQTYRVRVGGAGEDDNGDNGKSLQLVVAGTNRLVNATGATPYVSGGAATSIPFGPEVVVGRLMVLLRQKRGSTPFCFNNNTDTGFENVRFLGSTAVPITGKGNRRPRFTDIRIQGRGVMGSNAGGIIMSDTREVFQADTLYMQGCGDNFFTNFITAIGITITDYAGPYIVAAWADPLTKNVRPPKPAIGDPLSYRKQTGEVVAQTNTVIGYDVANPNKVLLSGNHPEGYDTTWRIENRGFDCTVKFDTWYFDTTLTAGILFATRTRGKNLTVRRTYSEHVRVWAPSSNFQGRATGASGDVIIENGLFEWGNQNDRVYRRAAVTTRRLQSNQDTSTVTQAFPAITFGKLTTRNIGAAVVAAQGFDVRIGVLDCEPNRSTLTAPEALVNIYAAAGSQVTVGAVEGSYPTTYTDTGGIIALPVTAAQVAAKANQAYVDAATAGLPLAVSQVNAASLVLTNIANSTPNTGVRFQALVPNTTKSRYIRLDGRGKMVGNAGQDLTVPLTSAALTSLRDPTTGFALNKRHFRSQAASVGKRPCVQIIVRSGQSLSTANGESLYTTTATYPGDVLMLNGTSGIRAPYFAANTATGLTDAREFLFNPGYYESGLVAMLNRMAAKTVSAVGQVPLLGGIVGGQGGLGIADLRRGTAAWDAILNAIALFRDYADLLGYDVMVPAMIWRHGNAAAITLMARQEYADHLIRLRQEFAADVRALTGQPEDVILYADQPDVGKSTPQEVGGSIGQVDAAKLDPRIRLLGFHADIVKSETSDGVTTAHPYSLGYLQIGERDAEIIWQDLFCGGVPDFVITRAWRKAGNKIGLQITPKVPPLVIDTADTLMPANQLPGKGFVFDDGSGAAPTITGVTLISGGTAAARTAEVELTLSAAPTGLDWRVFHATIFNSALWPHGPLTALRDSSGAQSSRDASGAPATGGNGRPLYNFPCPQVVGVR